jgi:hypothetical protein
MNAVHLRHGGDHVSALGFTFSRHADFVMPIFLSILLVICVFYLPRFHDAL